MKTVESKKNSVMERLLSERKQVDAILDEKLLGYLGEGVIERKDCVILKALKASSRDPVLGADRDETWYESFENHIHIDPLSPEDTSALDRGLTFVNRLAQVLRTSDYPGPFRIILTYNLVQRMCTVRFHRIRPDQFWVDESELENFSDAGIMLLDI